MSASATPKTVKPTAERPALSAADAAELKKALEAYTAREEREHRLAVLAELVVHGGTRTELLDAAQRQWNVSRRTAQEYLQTVQQRFAALFVEQAFRFVLPLLAGVVVSVPHLGERAHMLGRMIPIQNRRQIVGQMTLQRFLQTVAAVGHGN